MLTMSMETTLEAARFFADSANSVRVFETLIDGPTTSRDLAEQTGASRSTVARILAEGESREWINSKGSRYELTELGEVMIEVMDLITEYVADHDDIGPEEAEAWASDLRDIDERGQTFYNQTSYLYRLQASK